MGLFKRLQGWAPRMEWKPCNSLLRNPYDPGWPQHTGVLGRFQGTSGQSLFCCQPEKLHPHASSQGCNSWKSQQTIGGTTPPRTSLMLPALVWGLGRSHCSQNHHPQQLGMAPGCAELGLCPCRHVSVALSPQPSPPCVCFGQLRGPPCTAGQWQEQCPLEQLILPCMTSIASSPALCTRHCQSCRQHVKGAGAMPAKGDKDTEAGALLAPSKAQRHSLE